MSLRSNGLLVQAAALLACLVLLPTAAYSVDMDNDGIDASVDPNDRVPRYHVSAGDRHNCSLSDEGVFCWGFNFHKRTVVPSLTQPLQVSAGREHTCAISAEGVTCWGQNSQGQTTVPPLVSPRIVTAGGDFSCALDANGVTCWGSNSVGQRDVPPLVNPVTVSAGRQHACAVDDTGVVCWGLDTSEQTLVPPLDGEVVDVNVKEHSSCALTTQGVQCWGAITAAGSVPPLENPVQISTGNGHACALDDHGVHCWGNNSSGQTDVPLLSGPVQVSAGGSHTCARDDHGLHCWGNNADGAGALVSLNAPSVVAVHSNIACAIDGSEIKCWGTGFTASPPTALNQPVALAIGGNHGCSLDADGVTCWGGNDAFNTPPPLNNPDSITVASGIACATDDSGVKCWGDSTSARQTDVPSITGATQVSASGNHVCATNGNTPYCWGYNASGQTSPTVTSGVSDIVAGGYHSCAIAAGAVSCWGDNTSFKLLVPALSNPYKLFANLAYTCALHDNGLSCWGDVRYGQRSRALQNPVSASIDFHNACAIDDSGLQCWGQNSYSTTSVPYTRNFLDQDGDGVADTEDGAPYDPTSTSANIAPVAEITTPEAAIENVEAIFSGTNSSDTDGTIVSWLWDFDKSDGVDFSTPDAEGESAAWSYAAAGNYTVTLRVTDDRGGSHDNEASVSVLADSDGDGVADDNDAFPDHASASVDDDADGYPDDCTSAQDCIDDGLTEDPSLDDYDNDGIKSAEDEDDTADTSAPTVIAPPDIDVIASDVETEINLLMNGTPYASDFPNVVLDALPDTDSNATELLLPSGRHQVNWCASDAAGNGACAPQIIDITPLVMFERSEQIVAEGVDVEVLVVLSGNPVSYPVVIPVQLDEVTSTASVEDHNAASTTVTINAPDPEDDLADNTGRFVFSSVDDGVTGESPETVILSLVANNSIDTLSGAALASEALITHTVTITEANVPPVVTLHADAEIALADETKTYSIDISDPNGHEIFFVSWYLDDTLIASGNNLTEIVHDLADLSVGTYTLRVTVLDDGSPAEQGSAEQLVTFTAAKLGGAGSAGTGFIVALLLLLARPTARRGLLCYCRQ